MNHRPITEDDLHAYVDSALEPERRAEVASYLADHPDVAKRIAAFADQRELLRAALAPIADEPLPAELNLSRIIEGRRRRASPVWWAIAAMLLLSVGGVGGWAMRGSLEPAQGGLAALAQEAAVVLQGLRTGPGAAGRDACIRRRRARAMGLRAGLAGRSRCPIWRAPATG